MAHISVGDRIVIMSTHVDEPERTGHVLEVLGAEGGPPYRVRWDADEHSSIIFPGPDAHIDPVPTASES